jgi:hypothetical protein
LTDPPGGPGPLTCSLYVQRTIKSIFLCDAQIEPISAKYQWIRQGLLKLLETPAT